MKVIKLCYSNEIRWIDELAGGIGGTKENNFIKADNEIHKGTHFILDLEERIWAMLIDVTYKEDVLVQVKNNKNNFVGVYFYLTDQDIDFILDDESKILGQSNYNLIITDLALDTEYFVKDGTRNYAVCLFIEKDFLKEYMNNVPKLKLVSKDLFDEEKNTIISLGRMGSLSLSKLEEFKKISYDDPLFELYFRGLTYNLLGHFLQELLLQKVIICKVIEEDMKSIIASKAFLLQNIDEVFPGVDFLANQANMSPSKYKKIFTKISGLSPGSFFYSHKLMRAKEMLATGKYTVSEVSDKLNYSTVSYLAKRFNNKFGVFPKEYQSFL